MVSKQWTPSSSGANLGFLCWLRGCWRGALLIWPGGVELEFPSSPLFFIGTKGFELWPIEKLNFWQRASKELNIDIIDDFDEKKQGIQLQFKEVCEGFYDMQNEECVCFVCSNFCVEKGCGRRRYLKVETLRIWDRIWILWKLERAGRKLTSNY